MNASSWAVYTIQANVPSGTHEVAIAFTNDYYNQPQDRNLYVDKVTLTEAGGNLPPEVSPEVPPEVPPVASIFSNSSSGIAPLTVNFDGSGSYDPDGEIVSYDWDFGDGTTDSGETVSHTFSDPGMHTVTLTVTDDQGATDLDTIQISASSGQAPVVDAGAVDLIILPIDTVNLDGTVTDDGLPDPPGMVIPAWSQVSGPGTVVFDDAGAVDTTATFSEAGTYVLQLAADD